MLHFRFVKGILLSAIVLSAALGPICPLQMAFAAPLQEEELLMTLAMPEDLQACEEKSMATIGKRADQCCEYDGE